MTILTVPPLLDLSSEGIRALREARGLTRLEFASILGVTVPCVWMWENGTCKPNNYSRGLLREYAAQL